MQPQEEAGSQYQTNSFNNNNSGQSAWYSSTGIGWWGDNYISPWDIWYRNHPSPVPGFGILQPWYYITNGNVDDPSPYDIRVYSYVGLAYFDGVNDGTFDDTNPYSPNSISLATNFPTLYANSQEVGNLVRVTNSFDVPANSGLRIEDKLLHLANTQNPAQGSGQGFFFSANITPQEQDLLYNYGKVFFYEVEVYDSTTGALVLSTLMHPEIKTLPSGPPDLRDHGWKRVKDLGGNLLSGAIPGIAATAPLYYFHDDTPGVPQDTQWDIAAPFDGNLCNSREVVFDVGTGVPHEVDIDSTYKLKLGFFASGQTGWINSALHLTVTGR